MIGASKILTVSYGTFSCTLEGFDEPFSTMKAIAEYFRDLAADDRYFGAEPPTPDAEMLHRIAEKEIQRRVEAKISEYGVVLRQAEAAPVAPVVPATAPTPAPVPVAVPVAAEPSAPAPQVLPAAVAAAEPVAAEPVEEVAEPVAEIAVPPMVAEPADLPEVAEVKEPLAEPAVEPAAEEIAAEVEPEPAPEPVAEYAAEPVEDFSIGDFSIDDILAQVEPAAEAEPAAAEADEAPAPLVLTGDDAALALPVEEPAEAVPVSDEESVAAKLMRIRAVVESVRSAPPAYEDDEPASENPDAARMPEDFGFALDLSEDMPELKAAEAARAEARAGDDLAGVDFDDDVGTADLAADEADDVAETAESDVGPVEAVREEEAAPEADEDADLLARLSALGATSPAPTTEAVAQLETEAEAQPDSIDEPVDANIAAIVADADDYADDADEDASAATDAEEPQPSFYQRARARVIRLSKAVTHGSAATDDEAVESEPAAEALSPAEAPADDQITAETSTDWTEDGEHDDDPDVNRLMAEAKEKLEGAESRRRFSAISHLKAAVAATLADRKLQPPADQPVAAAESPALDLYREDLSKAVRPRRPTTEAGATTQRPSLDMRPAPLVLVSEQRVDRPAGEEAASAIRPRRVVAGAAAYVADDDEEDLDDLTDLSPEDVSSFAEFAERLGASNLTELLEAAAAYTSSVEGRQSFSRPHLLRKVEFVSSRGAFSREDGMRSFGMLLRQGKIQKVSRGQFTITDTSKFMHEARKAM